MKKYLVILMLISGLFMLSQSANAESYSFSDLEFGRMSASFSLSYSFKLGSYHLFKSWGFSPVEARYFSYFAGILVGLGYEFATNFSNSGFKRESSLIGIGMSLLVFRF